MIPIETKEYQILPQKLEQMVFENIHQAKKGLERKMTSIQQKIILNGRYDTLVQEEKKLKDVGGVLCLGGNPLEI